MQADVLENAGLCVWGARVVVTAVTTCATRLTLPQPLVSTPTPVVHNSQLWTHLPQLFLTFPQLSPTFSRLTLNLSTARHTSSTACLPHLCLHVHSSTTVTCPSSGCSCLRLLLPQSRPTPFPPPFSCFVLFRSQLFFSSLFLSLSSSPLICFTSHHH